MAKPQSIETRLTKLEEKIALSHNTHIIWAEGIGKDKALRQYQGHVKPNDLVVFVTWCHSHEVETETNIPQDIRPA